MVKILHFADAHIDIATYGKHDPETGLPVRVLDFLNALDTIIDTAIREKVDLVLFAGDAYKDRTPSPTFQREWGKRIIRLPMAGIPVLLLVGNHDISPASGRAHTLQEFDTLQVPNVRVLNKPELLKPADLWGLPLQVIALPWVFRSTLMAAMQLSPGDDNLVNEELEQRITIILEARMNELDPTLPTIFTAHGSVQGAMYGNERTVMLGKDLVLPGSLVKDPRLDYVALGHIHKHQDLNPGAHPPVIYPGSIERVDFGEAADDKGFMIAEVDKGHTNYRFIKLDGRAFYDRTVKIDQREGMMERILAVLPADERITDSILKLTIEYPRELEMFLDETVLREKCASALEFHLIRRPQEEARLRLPSDQSIASLSPLELLTMYWNSVHTKPVQTDTLHSLARSIIQSVSGVENTLDLPGGE
ncbi:MAG TPA: exonuclease SbcCD subunit D [Anaerolineaceae bacterium]|nr:exonuclease SbcCD subunit D [Anaerolineaceae bacterium]